MRFIFLIVVVAIMMIGCNSSNTVTSNAVEPQLLLHDVWVLEWMQGKEVDQINFTRGLPMLEIFVVDGRVQGNNGCNQINGPIEISKEALKFGPLISTRMACKDDGFEQAFMKLLEQPLGYKVENGTLTLYQNNKEVLRFKKAD